MWMGTVSQSSNADIVSKIRSFIVYDRATGAVLHVHHAVEFETRIAGQEAHESRARRFAGAGATDTSAVLEAPADQFNQAKPTRVDPVTLAVHWEPHPRRTSKGRRASRV
jgi:hypothetical protein